MFEVDNEPTETLHIYVVREEAPKPSLLPIFLSVVALSLLVAFGVLSPTQQPVMRAVIRIPAVPLGIKAFTASAQVIPTGVKTYPATTARGVLTITNGSIIGQVIPASFTISNVATDYVVYVPPGNANGYGYATVSAHATLSGQGGNLSPYSINSVVGSSVYIRNLSAFTGGHDAYSVKFATAQDRQTALLQARGILLSKSSGLHYPCKEFYSLAEIKIGVLWQCRFISYHIPSFYHVTAVRLSGQSLVIDVWFIPRPVHIWVK